jgi:hypothetical protein
MFRTSLILSAITLVLLTASASAGTFAVGTCLPNLTSFPTISQAVNKVPPGSTVEVCPGSYAEQVTISQPLMLVGVSSGDSGAAVVTVPTGGLTQSVTPNGFFKTFYQILVQNTTGPVQISNLAVDGTGEDAQLNCFAGILYLDSTGTVSNVSARNDSGLCGTGIFALTSSGASQTVTIRNNVVRGLGSGYGIVAYIAAGSLTANIQGNTIRNNSAASGYGIEVYQATGTVQSNAIDNTTYGLLLFNSAVTATANTISSTFIGAEVFAGSNTVRGNKIDAGGQTGMLVSGYTVTNPVVQGNTIVNASTAILGCDTSGNFANGFTVTNNTILDAAVGMQMSDLGVNVTAPNSYYETETVIARPCL